MRVAVAGFQHETNTFASHRAELADFEQADAWPGLTRGAALPERVAGSNLPLAGFLQQAPHLGFEPVPILWCAATPSGVVSQHAYETIVAELLLGVEAARPLDAVYLDLHGAMVCEHLQDGEGELLHRLRAIVGPELPVVASLDFHANVSEQMVRAASGLDVYRTYPHVDMAETGARAASLLRRLLAHGPLYMALQRGSFLIPLTSQCTLTDPMATLITEARLLERAPVASVSLAAGFPSADVFCCSPTVLALADTPGAADNAARALIEALEDCEADFALPLFEPEDAVREALALSVQGTGPVVLADTQDNPGAGSSSDTTTLLRALVQAGAPSAVVALMHDPEAAKAAHAAGVGAELSLALGGRSGTAGDAPYSCTTTVRALGSGRFQATGPFYAGCRFDLGPMALLEVAGVRVAVSHRRQQAADQAMLRHLGVEPARERILALKSSVHFRADFEPIASAVLVVAGAGANPADPASQKFHRLRPGVRLRPLGPPFAPGAP